MMLKLKNIFTILSNNIPEDTREILADMLEENVSTDKIIYGFITLPS